jgi:hypothetical protein
MISWSDSRAGSDPILFHKGFIGSGRCYDDVGIVHGFLDALAGLNGDAQLFGHVFGKGICRFPVVICHSDIIGIEEARQSA